jgi:demethylmenaquinone methyltransferase/2-methoxy-6-polyprenyl-1,4-benzoquinol methylase
MRQNKEIERHGDSSSAFAALGPQPFVNSVFDRVAGRYDLMNDLMSGGMHRLWKDALINWLAPSPSVPAALLDVAGGTGDISTRFLNASAPGSTAVICDINASMMQHAIQRHEGWMARGALQFVQANGESLPFKPSSFDACTIAFGIRNIPDIAAALAGAFRVLKPGGRFLCLEFSQVTVPILDTVYNRYSDAVLPALGRAVAGDGEPYRYLVDSIRRFPDQSAFAKMIAEAGFSRVQFRNLSGGIAALHSGIKI